MIQPKDKTEDLLLSITKNCETLFEQTHTKPQETLEFEMVKSGEIFHFNPTIQIKEDWMIRLVSLEAYNSIFNITEENNNFEFYSRYLEDEFSYNQLKNKAAEVFGFSDITREELKHETFGLKIIETFIKFSTEKSQTDEYFLIFSDYVCSFFRDFESYLGSIVGLDEDDIQIVLKQYTSKIITYKIPPGAYTFEDLSILLSRGFIIDFEIRRRMRPNHKN